VDKSAAPEPKANKDASPVYHLLTILNTLHKEYEPIKTTGRLMALTPSSQ